MWTRASIHSTSTFSFTELTPSGSSARIGFGIPRYQFWSGEVSWRSLSCFTSPPLPRKNSNQTFLRRHWMLETAALKRKAPLDTILWGTAVEARNVVCERNALRLLLLLSFSDWDLRVHGIIGLCEATDLWLCRVWEALLGKIGELSFHLFLWCYGQQEWE